ncbi:MAG: DUF4330 family protein [Lawsonibacter sp.]|nr:DUF4330 family protein [Lawsonibacter sp.]
MEQNTPKFRLRLNLFDCIVLLAALAVAVFLLWNRFKPQAPAEVTPQASSTVRYTVLFQRWREGTSSLIQPEDALIDNIKNAEIGHVVCSQAVPAQFTTLDHANRVQRQAILEGYEDVLVVVEAPCTVSDESIQVGGDYVLRVGATTFIKGPGYMGSGPIIAIEQEAAQ